MPELSFMERLFFCSGVWRAGSGIRAYTIPVDMLGVDILEIGAGSGAVVICADATGIPFGGASFDSVMSCLMLHHVVDRERAVSEIARVLRPAGRLVGLDLTRSWLTNLIHELERPDYRLTMPTEFSTVCTAPQPFGRRPDSSLWSVDVIHRHEMCID